MRLSIESSALFRAYTDLGWSWKLSKPAIHVIRITILLVLGFGIIGSTTAQAEDASLILHRGNRTIVLEPYAPNIIRVTLSSIKAKALAHPGYGFLATPLGTGWVHQKNADGHDVYRSQRLVLTVSLDHPHSMPLDAFNLALGTKFFGSSHWPGPNNDSVTITTPTGKMLVTMKNWSMVPNPSDSSAAAIGENQMKTTPATAYLPPSILRRGSTITDLGNINMDFWTCVITGFDAGTITERLVGRMYVFRLWFRAAATGSSGTIRLKPQSTSGSISKMSGHPRWETAFLSL
jgi:hypothetical protein